MPIWLESATKLAPIVTATIALFALVFAYRQLRTARANEAKRQYVAVLKAALEEPTLASGKVPRENLELYRQYRWYLTALLMACEELVDCFPKDEEWKLAVMNKLELHSEMLASKSFRKNEFATYSKRFRKLIDEVIKNKVPGTAT